MNTADVAIQFALAQVGKPYKWGATGPDSFDCSGLVYAAFGKKIGRTTYQQILMGVGIAQNDMEPGDLCFPDVGHVQLYIGGGNVVEAPHTGAFVRVVPARYWKARRITTPGGGIGLVGDTKAAGGQAAGCAPTVAKAVLFLASFGEILAAVAHHLPT